MLNRKEKETGAIWGEKRKESMNRKMVMRNLEYCRNRC